MTQKLIVGGILIVVLVAIAWWVFSPSPAPPAQHPATLPPPAGSLGGATTTGSRLSIPALGGGTVEILDPKTDPLTAKDPFNTDNFYLGYHIQEAGAPEDPTATVGAPYNIEYIESTHFFNIVLLQEPIGKARQEAEQYLLMHLGVSQSDLCRLDYMVAVPHWVSEQYTSRNLLFSFCPNATVLPQ
jgi:hypothetical protein